MTEVAKRKLGCSELAVSAIGLGCMSLSGVYGAADDAENLMPDLAELPD